MFEPLEGRICLAGSVGWDGAGRRGAALTYFIGAAPPSLDQETVDAAIKTALNAWSSVANIKFTQTSVPNRLRSLDLTFVPIDGDGGVLARGFLPADVNPPRIAGDVQFDSTELWEVGDARGNDAVDLVLVAVHEIGHSLGLEHSRVSGSVMSASISSSASFSGLAPSDVNAIRSLYAPARSKATLANSTTPTTPATSDEAPEAPPKSRPHPRPRLPKHWRGRFGRAIDA